jgi:hypothetical protein
LRIWWPNYTLRSWFWNFIIFRKSIFGHVSALVTSMTLVQAWPSRSSLLYLFLTFLASWVSLPPQIY